jgi:hypothetical protein
MLRLGVTDKISKACGIVFIKILGHFGTGTASSRSESRLFASRSMTDFVHDQSRYEKLCSRYAEQK